MRLEIGQSARLRSQRMPKRMHAFEDRGTCKVTREEERLSSPPLAATGTSPLARQPQHICGRRKHAMRCGQAVRANAGGHRVRAHRLLRRAPRRCGRNIGNLWFCLPAADAAVRACGWVQLTIHARDREKLVSGVTSTIGRNSVPTSGGHCAPLWVLRPACSECECGAGNVRRPERCVRWTQRTLSVTRWSLSM